MRESAKEPVTFRQVQVGQSFDFINDDNRLMNSFYLRCVKTSTRTYIDETGSRHAIGSLGAKVYHVEPIERPRCGSCGEPMNAHAPNCDNDGPMVR